MSSFCEQITIYIHHNPNTVRRCLFSEVLLLSLCPSTPCPTPTETNCFWSGVCLWACPISLTHLHWEGAFEWGFTLPTLPNQFLLLSSSKCLLKLCVISSCISSPCEFRLQKFPAHFTVILPIVKFHEGVENNSLDFILAPSCSLFEPCINCKI